MCDICLKSFKTAFVTGALKRNILNPPFLFLSIITDIYLIGRRNDYISSVREACQVALEQIGGDEANKAMHITNLLAKEIRMLTQE